MGGGEVHGLREVKRSDSSGYPELGGVRIRSQCIGGRLLPGEGKI